MLISLHPTLAHCPHLKLNTYRQNRVQETAASEVMGALAVEDTAHVVEGTAEMEAAAEDDNGEADTSTEEEE